MTASVLRYGEAAPPVFTRLSWIIPNSDFLFEKYGAGGLPKAEERFKPESKFHLVEVIERYGLYEIPEWDGSERKARGDCWPQSRPGSHTAFWGSSPTF